MRKLAGLIAALAAVPFVASAQVAPTEAEKIRAAGQSMDPALFDIFAPYAEPEPWEDVAVLRDIAYGDDEKQRLDIYRPSHGGQDMPVLLFVHAGGFVGGDKSGAYHPDNITLWAARNNMVGVNMNYRLAPDHPWPAANEDIASAIDWIGSYIETFGGDPGRMFLWGYSAGANHVADYVGHVERQGPGGHAVKGAILLSPNYLFELEEEPHPYYGADAALQQADAVIARLGDAEIPLFLAYAEFDPDTMKRFAETAGSRLCSQDRNCPRTLYLHDHNHFTEGSAVGSYDRSLSGPLLDWMKATD